MKRLTAPLLVAFALAGCAETTTQRRSRWERTGKKPRHLSTLSKVEFIQEADAICQKRNKEVDAVNNQEGLSFPEQAEKVVRSSAAVRPSLRALEPPEELAIQVNQYLAALEDQARLYGQSGEAEDQRSPMPSSLKPSGSANGSPTLPLLPVR